MTERTRFLRNVVEEKLRREEAKPGVLSGFFEAFQTFLIGTLTAEILPLL